MLWRKGWLETRYRLLFLLGFGACFQILQRRAGDPRQVVFGLLSFAVPTLVIMSCAMLAGTGVATQPSFVAAKGIHGSTLFTLALPVSRFRLLSIRAAIGWFEAIGVVGCLCCGLWFLHPALRAMAGPEAMLRYASTLIACASTFYAAALLLGVFLDDQWRIWGTMLTSAGLWWLSANTPIPVFLDIIRGMGKGSPLIAHTMPWGAIVFSVLLAAVLFLAALNAVRAREY
jgi:hypothetical protein